MSEDTKVEVDLDAVKTAIEQGVSDVEIQESFGLTQAQIDEVRGDAPVEEVEVTEDNPEVTEDTTDEVDTGAEVQEEEVAPEVANDASEEVKEEEIEDAPEGV